MKIQVIHDMLGKLLIIDFRRRGFTHNFEVLFLFLIIRNRNKSRAVIV